MVTKQLWGNVGLEFNMLSQYKTFRRKGKGKERRLKTVFSDIMQSIVTLSPLKWVSNS